MPHRRCVRFVSFMLAAGAFLAVAGIFPEPTGAQQKILLTGQVAGERGGTVKGPVSLQLETTNGAVVDQRVAGPDGRFEFPDLDNIIYNLRISAPDYQTLLKEVDLSGPRRDVYVSFTLTPLNKTKVQAANLPALSDEQAPRNARKEYERGNRALQDKNFQGAQKEFKKAVEEFPCYARAQTDLALTFVEQKDYASAEAALRKSIACDADFLTAYERLGILLNGTRRYSESEKVLEDGLRRSPRLWSLHYQLASAYSGLNQYDKSVTEFEQVKALNPDPPAELHLQLGDVFIRMKNYDAAYGEFKAYLSAKPNGPLADRTRQVLQKMAASGVVHAAAPGASHPPPPKP